MEYNRMNLGRWIKHVSGGSKSLVELGAGFFGHLESLNESVEEKIGIEIYQPYIDNASYDDCIKIQGDVRNYRELLKDYQPDTAMIIDVLEHLTMEDALELIDKLKEDFEKIMLMLPVGNHPQETDLTGYGGHEYQTHRSTWNLKEIENLGFQDNVIDDRFHQGDPVKDAGCYFGVWTKD